MCLQHLVLVNRCCYLQVVEELSSFNSSTTDSSNNGWLVPDAVDTGAPDDGWRNHSKNVQQFTDKINCVQLYIVLHLLKYNCDTWSHEHNILYMFRTVMTNYLCETSRGQFNLQAPCMLYIGQTYHYSTEYAFYIFSPQIYLIIFLDFLSPSSFILTQNIVYFLMLPFLVHKIFKFYTNDVLNCKCPAPGPDG